jgi:hypothetical protein
MQRKSPLITVKPVRAIKAAITRIVRNQVTGEFETVVNHNALHSAVAIERRVFVSDLPRHTSIERLLTGLSKPSLERVLASVSA